MGRLQNAVQQLKPKNQPILDNTDRSLGLLSLSEATLSQKELNPGKMVSSGQNKGKEKYVIFADKIAKKEEKDNLIFVFLFTDGLYYIKYDQQVFETFGTDDITYYRKGIQPKAVKHMCIPIELLVMISKNEGFPCRM